MELLNKSLPQLDAPDVLATYQKQNYHLQQLKGLFAWQQQKPELWQVTAEHLQGFINKRAMPLTTLSVEKKSSLLTIAGEKINLEQMAFVSTRSTYTSRIKKMVSRCKTFWPNFWCGSAVDCK
jgi:hypothetical protein